MRVRNKDMKALDMNWTYLPTAYTEKALSYPHQLNNSITPLHTRLLFFFSKERGEELIVLSFQSSAGR